MANNSYVNKVEYAGQTLMDLTGDTVTPSKVLNGETFHDRSGTPQQGSMITHDVYDGLDSTSTDDALSANQGRVLNDQTATLNRQIKTSQRLIEYTGTSQETKNLSPNPDNYSLLCVVVYDANSNIVGSATVSPDIASITTIKIYGESSSQWGSFRLSQDHQQGIFNRTSSNTTKIQVFGIIG